LGFVVRDGHRDVDPDKIKCIVEYQAPKNIKQLRRFLGMISWFRRFVEKYNDHAEPLLFLLRRKVRWVWKIEQDNAFNKLKSCLISPPILACPNYKYAFVIQCDASGYAIGGALTQTYDGGDHVIVYLSRALTQQERNYSATEREALAVIYCLEKLRPYIEGLHVDIITDHFSLVWLFNLKNPTGRLARWISRFQQFDFTIIHRKGSHHHLPDALSRINLLDDDPNALCDFSDIKDKKYLDLRKKVLDNPELYKNFNVSNGKVYKQVLNRDGESAWKLFVPRDKIQFVLNKYHSEPTSGHLGVMKTYFAISQFYFWHCMSRDVRKFMQRCRVCQQYKASQNAPAGLMSPVQLLPPWKIVASDIIGPLVRTAKGNKFILVFVDLATRWPIAVSVRSTTAKVVAQQFYKHVILQWGCPEICLTDNGVQYVSKIFKGICEQFGIIHKLTPLYHPQSNPTERLNRVLKTSISIFCNNHHRDWDIHLDEILFAIRSTKHETTGFSPAYLNFAREFRKPNSLHRDLDNVSYTENSRKLASDLINNLKLAFNEAADIAERQSQAQAKYYNMRRNNVEFEVGSLVWRRNKELSNAAAGINQGLLPKYVGPFQISKKISSVSYQLSNLIGKVVGLWHISDLKKVV
jgi:hypothetical protein